MWPWGHRQDKKRSEIWGVCVGGGGGGALIPSPKAVGLESVPPPPPQSSIPLMLPLQISCSIVVAKLISNSCAPPPLPPSTRLREVKRAPVRRLLPRWAYVIGLGMKKYKICPFFLRCGLCFLAFFFQILSPPPPPPPILLTRALLFF